ncbi:MAG: amino acid permease [Planctomycetes bacterium]|nr:amino acid permease [Planctomycetota bacterium]
MKADLAQDATTSQRNIGLIGATMIGVGAIVGGGVLALAGTAFASAGPAALVAFALNGVIAFMTARSFASMASAFPQSGGSYNFAKMVLTVRAAFAVGWVVWFASIVAGVLYALGFAVYAVIIIREIYAELGKDAPAWLNSHAFVVVLAAGATLMYTLNLLRKSAGGGNLETIGKVIIFILFILFGLWALSFGEGVESKPVQFFHRGTFGLIEAMGFTFIALQGFDLIAAVGGEVKEPKRNIPRAMYLSLAIALLIYLPLLTVVMTVGVGEGGSIVEMAEGEPDAVVAVAAKNILGKPGFWMIAVAALLSMLSALQANLFAASRIAKAMARDRTLPWAVGKVSEKRDTPVGGVLASAGLLVTILLVIPDVASAGAAASLIFLITFALVHWTSLLAQKRGAVERRRMSRTLPVIGGLLCVALALFQGVAVPSAGAITLIWVAIGASIYLTLFSRRAEAIDAADVARNPMRSQARGENPLVLLPIANPASAAGLVSVAHALIPPSIGRVLLLFVIRQPEGDTADQALKNTQELIGQTLSASFKSSLYPEALTTVAREPWPEIARVARTRGCQSLLMGMSKLTETEHGEHLEQLMSGVDSDVVVLRAKPEWNVDSAKRILVPVGGKGAQDELRARLLGSLSRTADREVIYMRVIGLSVSDPEAMKIEEELERVAMGEAPGFGRVRIIRSNNAISEVISQCEDADLTIIGVQRMGKRKKHFGRFAMRVVQETTSAVMLISRRG